MNIFKKKSLEDILKVCRLLKFDIKRSARVSDCDFVVESRTFRIVEQRGKYAAQVKEHGYALTPLNGCRNEYVAVFVATEFDFVRTLNEDEKILWPCPSVNSHGSLGMRNIFCSWSSKYFDSYEDTEKFLKKHYGKSIIIEKPEWRTV